MTLSMRARVAALGGYAAAAKYGGVAVTAKARRSAAEVRDERLMAHFGIARGAADYQQRITSARAYYYRQIRMGRRADEFLLPAGPVAGTGSSASTTGPAAQPERRGAGVSWSGVHPEREIANASPVDLLHDTTAPRRSGTRRGAA